MAFDPNNMPPGIEPSPDKMLQVNLVDSEVLGRDVCKGAHTTHTLWLAWVLSTCGTD